MNKIKDNYTAEIIITLVVLIMLLTSCSFNQKADAMPPVHTLYPALSKEEKKTYDELSAKERGYVNRNTEMHQLKQALAPEIQNEYEY